MTRFVRQYADLILTGALTLVFAAWPNLDLALVSCFYQPGGGFPAARISWVNFIYETVARAWVLALVWLIFLAAGLMPWFRARWAA